MGRAITIRGFQLIANLALISPREALFSNSRPGTLFRSVRPFRSIVFFEAYTGLHLVPERARINMHNITDLTLQAI
jgi:hypothetical protein